MESRAPLAERMRPSDISEVAGQAHLVGPDGIITKALAAGVFPSVILWGPPGVGKTTLAGLIASKLERPFFTLSAISSGVKDVREVIAKAEGKGLFSQNAILFIDEIHRFSKSQQDSLLGAVERGSITLIGATTENPSFEVINALLSRCQVYVLESLGRKELMSLVDRALTEDEELKDLKIIIKEDKALLRASGGDARRLLNTFEIAVSAARTVENGEALVIDDALIAQVVQRSSARYDKTGEQHYDIISAFIKSIRGSDADAAVYWLARMVEGGEDPKFIARRLIISASEDIGLANPNALLLATNAAQAVQTVGWPESRIVLSQVTIYLANSAKSNSAYMAINEAQAAVRQSGDLPVPMHLRNAPTKLMKELGYGDGYKYSHSDDSEQEFLPSELHQRTFYEAGNNGQERKMRK